LPSVNIVTNIFLAVPKEIAISTIINPIFIRVFWALSVFNSDTSGKSDGGGSCSLRASGYLVTTRKIHLLGVILIKMALIILIKLTICTG
jgi:hypothetical protein